MNMFECEEVAFLTAGPHHNGQSGHFSREMFCFQIADDDKILPGVEGKIVVWVEEE